MILTSSSFSRLRCWVGVRSWSKITASAWFDAMEAASSRTFPDPMSVAASTLSRLWMTRSTTTAPALRASSASSSRDSSESKVAAARLFRSSPTRIARSRPVFCAAEISGLRGFLLRHSGGERRALGLRRRSRRAVGMAALERHDSGNRMLENQLLLIVGFQHQGILVETLDASGKLDSAQQVNRDDTFFLARVV